MKTYVIKPGFTPNFYPPLTKDQLIDFYDQHLFRPLRQRAQESKGVLKVKEELNLVGSVIAEASEEEAKALRQLGYQLLHKKTK